MRELDQDPVRVCLEEIMQGKEEERWSALIGLALSQARVRTAFIQRFAGLDCQHVAETRLCLEYSLWSKKRGMPDLGIELIDASSAVIGTVFIENKLGAGRTKHQPDGYLDEMRERHDKNASFRGAIVFVVPSGKADGLRDKISKVSQVLECSSFCKTAVLSHEELGDFLGEATAHLEPTEACRGAAVTYGLLARQLFRRSKEFGRGKWHEAREEEMKANQAAAESVIQAAERHFTLNGGRVRHISSSGRIVYRGVEVLVGKDTKLQLVTCTDAGLIFGADLLWLQWPKGRVSDAATRLGMEVRCHEALSFSRQSGIAGWSGVMIPIDLHNRTQTDTVDWIWRVVQAASGPATVTA